MLLLTTSQFSKMAIKLSQGTSDFLPRGDKCSRTEILLVKKNMCSFLLLENVCKISMIRDTVISCVTLLWKDFSPSKVETNECFSKLGKD